MSVLAIPTNTRLSLWIWRLYDSQDQQSQKSQMIKRAPAWSAFELKTLRRMYPTFSAHEISGALGRSFYSIEQKARDLQLFKGPKQRRWLPGEDQLLRTQYAAGRSTGEIGVLLSRSSRSVSDRLDRLGLRRARTVHPIGFEWTDKEGIVWRKVTATVGADYANWRRVDQLEWEEVHGPIPEGYTVMIINKYLPRQTSNMRLVRKDELWEAATGNHLPPELRELVVLRRLIEREARRPKRK